MYLTLVADCAATRVTHLDGQTLILTGRTIIEMIDMDDCIAAVESAFRRHAEGLMTVPPVVHLAAPDGAFHIKSAAFTGSPAFVAVKINGNFPENLKRFRLPTIQGVIVLCDGTNGFPLAIMDSSQVTAIRTSAATAVAARYLARNDADSVTIIGCGLQGRIQLRALSRVLPLRTVYAFDIDPKRCATFASELDGTHGITTNPISHIASGTLKSGVIVTCTTSRRAFLRPEHVQSGTFIAAIGADNEDKQELEPALLQKSRVVVDSLEQCAQIGELHHALDAGVMKLSDVAAELGSLISHHTGPVIGPGDIVVFDSTGSAIQDVAVAALVYQRARDRGIGTAVTLG